ncbi:MAG: hypothetical protein ACT4PL_12350 [Phycisphaerales bacterium]
MTKATEFAERQYETTFHLELGSGGGGPFVPTQPLEWHLGIDAATNARDAHRIWRVLNANVPRRMSLSPTLWPRLPRRFHSAISGRVVSLFFQFKVPKYNDGKKAKYRAAFGTSYYEVKITRHQQNRLAELHKRVQARAIVRYASPAFWTRADFDTHAARRNVLSQSAYMIPSRVGTHRKWMYATPSGKAMLNPDPEEVDSEAWESLVAQMGERAQEESLRVHVRALAQALRDTQSEQAYQPGTVWLSAIREYARLSPEDEAYLIDLRAVVDAAEQADTAWLVMVSPDDDTREMFEMFQAEYEMLWRHYWF